MDVKVFIKFFERILLLMIILIIKNSHEKHLYDPVQFFKDLSNTKLHAKLIFSIPNLNEMLKKKYTNCLNFEHTIL